MKWYTPPDDEADKRDMHVIKMKRTNFWFWLVGGLLIWPVRGQLGGWEGGFVAGVFFAALFVLTRKQISLESQAFSLLLSAYGFMWGGEISYGKQFWAVMNPGSSPGQVLINLTALTLMGASWGAIGGMGLGFGFGKRALTSKDILPWVLLTLIWSLTIVLGFGARIWIVFLLSAIIAAIFLKNRVSKIFSAAGAVGMGAGFLFSGVLLYAAGQMEGYWLAECFKLRDQVIGIAVAAGFYCAAQITSAEKSPKQGGGQLENYIFAGVLAGGLFAAANNVAAEWHAVGWINDSVFLKSILLSGTLSILFLTFVSSAQKSRNGFVSVMAGWTVLVSLLAVLKETLPGWPYKWETGYSLILMSLVIFLVLCRFKTAYK